MTKVFLLAVWLLAALSVGGATADAQGANPVTRVNLTACAYGTTRTVPPGNDVLLASGWVAATPTLTLLGEFDTNLKVWVDGVPIQRIANFYSPLTEVLNSQYAALWNDNIGPIGKPTTITVYDAMYFPIIDGVVFNADGSPYVFSGLQFAGSCTLLPG